MSSAPPDPLTRTVARMEAESRRQRIVLLVSLVVVGAILAWSVEGTRFSLQAVLRGLPNIARFFWEDLLPPNPGAIGRYLWPALETLTMAYVAAVIAAVVSVPLGLLGARNLVPNPAVRYGARGFVSFLRSVPDVVWAVLLVGAVGIGPLAGTIALTFGAIGMLGKNFADAFEDIDPGQVEALRAAGANPVQVILQAVWPQFLPAFVSWSFYRFDLNIRAGALVGIVGGGGIGFALITNIRLFQYKDAAMGILIIFAIIMVIELVTERTRDWILAR
jgi:phosphonate transport system permease protein